MLDRALGAYYEAKDTGLLEAYSQTVLRRVWRAQHFSWWMTSMLHRFSGATDFDLRRQIAELETVTSSPAGARLLAENYTGLPLTCDLQLRAIGRAGPDSHGGAPIGPGDSHADLEIAPPGVVGIRARDDSIGRSAARSPRRAQRRLR